MEIGDPLAPLIKDKKILENFTNFTATTAKCKKCKKTIAHTSVNKIKKHLEKKHEKLYNCITELEIRISQKRSHIVVIYKITKKL